MVPPFEEKSLSPQKLSTMVVFRFLFALSFLLISSRKVDLMGGVDATSIKMD